MSRTDEIVVRTPSIGIYDQLMQLLDSRGYTWSSGTPFASLHNYHNYREDTCICIDTRNKVVTYCNREYFLREKYDILAYGEYLKIPYEKSKHGDIRDFISKYHPKDPVIHTKTQVEYDELMAILHPFGWNWKDNSVNHYSRNYKDICINISSSTLKYASMEYYKESPNSYVVIDFKTFKNFFMPNLNKRVIEVLNACIK